MRSTNYQDILWDFVPQNLREGSFILRLFSDEAALYESMDERRSDNAFLISLPLNELVGTRDSKTRWTQHRVTREEAITVGRKLWQALPQEVTRSINEDSKEDEKPLRIKISSQSSRLTDLPWEWLTDETESPIALRENIRLVRTVPLHFKTPHLTVALPLKVLIVLTNPKDESLLNSYAELAAIRQGIPSDKYVVQECHEATTEGLKECLHSFLPHVVHYIGHAGVDNGEGNLILHGHDERTYWMAGADLSYFLPSSVRLICLSTCFTAPNYQLLGLTHFAHTSNKIQLPTMIANQYPLEEHSVRAFWERFYHALVENQGNVNEAVYYARLHAASVSDASFADWASFALVLRDRTGKALRIGVEQGEDLRNRQANELQAQYAARLANDLAEQMQVFGIDASKGIRERFDAETKRASDLLKSVE